MTVSELTKHILGDSWGKVRKLRARYRKHVFGHRKKRQEPDLGLNGLRRSHTALMPVLGTLFCCDTKTSDSMV